VTDGLPGELGVLLAQVNGFAAFDYGIQVYRVGERGHGPELTAWNDDATWKDTYQGLADGLFCFGQDLFGVQFAVEDGKRISTFDPETGDRTVVGETLDDWAAWLLADPDVHAAASFAAAWQDRHGPLDHDQRLLPRRLFVLGGTFDDENLVVRDAVTAMRSRGPIARQLHDAPDGATVHFGVTE
jgi:hypothetical protein